MLVTAGCGKAPPAPAAPSDVCASPSWQSARRALIEGLGLPARRDPPGTPQLGDPAAGDGFTVRGMRWPHPSVPGEFVHALAYLPEPAPTAPVPMLINTHGHWGAGFLSDEVNRRSQLAARGGWLVLSIAGRGMELGDATPAWRQLHHRDALYAQLRSRRSGDTPLGWDVVAGWSAVDLAAAGRLPLPVAMDEIGVMGFSGGAERAAALAATDPRIGPVVLGAYEYAFSSGHGHASCSCGVVRGAGEPLDDPVYAARPMPEVVSGYRVPVQSWRWLGLAACKPGKTPSPRPLLAWDGQPDDVIDSELLSVPGVQQRAVPGLHGVTGKVAAESWGWMVTALGGAISRAEISAAERAAEAGYLQIQASTVLPLMETQPAPGQLEQGPPPWRVHGPPNPTAAQRMLGLLDGLGDKGDPGAQLLMQSQAEQTLVPASDGEPGAPRRRAAWLVVLGEDEVLAGLGGLASVAAARPDAVVLAVRHRLALPGADVGPPNRLGIEVGTPAMGVVLQDVLAAHRRLVEHPDVDPTRIGFLGLGSGGVAALQAALLIGDGGPVALVSAPTTLFLDGPRSGDAPFAPWPEWTQVPLPSGASFDPWHGAQALEARVRWLDPRGGDGGAWTEHLPHGTLVTSLDELMKPSRSRQ